MRIGIVTAAMVGIGSLAWAQDAAPQAALPKQLSVGKRDGYFEPGALLQGWYTANMVSDAPDATTNDFRIRRAELKVSGHILPRVIAYRVMIDPAKVLETEKVEFTDGDGNTVSVSTPAENISVFQDLYITFVSDWADVSVGQFKIPVSWSGYNSSSKLLLPERAVVSRELGDDRDIGIRVAKTFEYFGYSAGIFNGSGLNKRDADDAKDFALRLEAYPIPELTLAGVVYATLTDRDMAKKDRLEGDIRYVRGPYLLQGEYIRGKDRDIDDTEDVDGQGFYAALGYKLGNIQPIFRISTFDPNLDADDDDEVAYEGGINYYIQGHEAKLQLSFAHTDVEPEAVNTLIAAAQVAF